jgi:methyl-accepting chemotaxis protein
MSKGQQRRRRLADRGLLGGVPVGVLNRLKIRTKLYFFVGFIALLLIGVGATGLYGIHSSKTALAGVYNDHLLAINDLNDIRNHQMQIRLQLLAARQETDAFEIVDAMDRVRSQIFQTDSILQPYGAKALSPEERALFDAFTAARQNFGGTGVLPMMDLLTKGDFAKADALRKDTLDPAYAKASTAIDALIHYQVGTAKAAYDAVTLVTNGVRVFSLASIAVGLALSLLIGFVITQSIGRAVTSLESAASNLADGDLTARVTYQANDELGKVAQAFNRMAEDFGVLIGQVRDSADQVTRAAGTLSETTDRVQHGSQGQTEQAGGAAVSIEALNEAVKEIALRTQGVVAAASEANQLSIQGQTVVNDAVAGIQQVAHTVNASAELVSALGQRSNQIGQIIQVIKGIAEQTNLLALNAAIEAARAGEQGRGFAVVADEVRNLAERTAQATSEISEMINAIQSETGSVVSNMERGSTQVIGGVEKANQAVGVLRQITDSIHGVVEMIEAIATATRSQSEATGEITVRVEDIARMAQENNRHIEATAEATHDLHNLSARFQDAVSRFRM